MNYLDDNPDLQFYLNQAIDWERIVAQVEIRSNAEEGHASTEDAVDFYKDVLGLIGAFSAREIGPHSAELDQEPITLQDGEVVFPPRLKSIFDQLADMGLHGLCLPRELDGLNCPLLVYLISAELVARGDVSVMTHHGFHGGIAMALLTYSVVEGTTVFDRETRTLQHTRFEKPIREMAEGKAWGSMDITEPDAGSDMGALRTRAEQDENGDWFITGQKIFVTSGHGRYHVVIARTKAAGDDLATSLEGLSLFLVETYTEDEDGNRTRFATIERIEEKLGHRASATVTMNFDQTPAQLIGKPGEGFQQMLLLMNNARIAVSFEALGLAESAYRLAKDYAAQRWSMGKPIARHEIIADMLDEMHTDIQGIRALTMRAAQDNEMANRMRLRLQHLTEPDTPEAEKLAADVARLKSKTRLATPLVKYLSSEKTVEIARRTLQIHGGCGYTTEYGAEKLLRDALVLPIYEGTSQIQALMATKDSLLAITKDPSRFLRRLTDTWRRSNFATNTLERRVATVQYRALSAQRALILRLVRRKWQKARQDEQLTIKEAFKHWDPKQDFAPALLHAERLTVLLADAAICKELLFQAKRWPDTRQELLERYLERAEPRSQDLLYRIEHTGERLLTSLKGPTTSEGGDDENPVDQEVAA